MGKLEDDTIEKLAGLEKEIDFEIKTDQSAERISWTISVQLAVLEKYARDKMWDDVIKRLEHDVNKTLTIKNDTNG